MRKHVYLAAPFFNEYQRDLVTFIEQSFMKAGSGATLPLFSPRLDGGILKADATDKERGEIFDSNVQAIQQAGWMLAVIDDFDTGTIWEMGLAHALGVEVLAYSDILGRGLNVMLAGGATLGFVNGRMDLANVISDAEASEPNSFPRNTWSGSIQ